MASQLDFFSFTLWQKQAFGASLLQRMLPNYCYFSEATGFGDYRIISNQLDIIWQKLSALPIKFDAEKQLEKLYPLTPEPDSFDFFAVSPAVDVCTGMECLLTSFIDKNSDCAQEISTLSFSGVQNYIEFIEHAQGIEDREEAKLLLEWECDSQTMLYQATVDSKASKKSCDALKKAAIGERFSNIGIEY